VNERLRIVVGDLSQPQLGLPPSQYEQLAAEMDLIVHNGAAIKLTQPYD